MGEIFLARLEGAAGFEKLYVIKRILPHLANDPRFRHMLIDEARIAANLSHANICHVYELAETDNQLYIVMEYLEGITLLALLRQYARDGRQLELGFVAGVVHQLTDGLHYAHELRSRDGEPLGIVHRDVTPSNIFLTESGVAKIHDFGVAKMKDASTTESGTVKGKFAYMAPEQLQGASIDRRVDVFALGVVIAEMLTGQRLFQRRTDYLTFRAIMEQPLPELRRHRPELPDALLAVVTRALARERDQRFATVRHLDAAIAAAVTRPWGLAEISEQIREDFGEEIRRHNAEVSAVIGRRSHGSIRTMPIVLQNPSDPDAEDYFAFETGVEVEPAPESAPRPAPVAGSPARSRWPVIAILGAAVAVLAIGLVALRSPAAPATRPSLVETSAVTAPYQEVIGARTAELERCASASAGHRAEPTRLVLLIGPEGRCKQVAFSPAAAGETAFGACVREVMMTAVFPRQTEDREVALAIR
jgi:serine/threonine-protein kinase